MKINAHFYNISITSSYNEKYFRQQCRQNQNTFMINNSFFENSAVYKIIRKILYSRRARSYQMVHAHCMLYI